MLRVDMIERYKGELIELLIRYKVLQFGNFTLKSGRQSPYFIDAGKLQTGVAIRGIGVAYAQQILTTGLECDLVFGPSYKGVPLSVATAIALADKGKDVSFAFDRKERKDHGEGGMFVGTEPSDDMPVVVVDDVITSGASVRGAVQLLRKAARIRLNGVLVAVDRQERGRGSVSTLKELTEELNVPIMPILTIREVVAFLHMHDLGGIRYINEEQQEAVEAYLETYGVKVGC